MSSWIGYELDILASSPAEMNQIAERLKQPSAELVGWIAQKDARPVDEAANNVKALLDFKSVLNLGHVDRDFNKARRFSLSSNNRCYGIVNRHLVELSQAFPTSIFLLAYYDMMVSYSGKRVIRAGEVVQEVFDGDQQVQGLDWALLDIFAPFRAEYYGEEHEFGSLWQSWVDAIVAAAKAFRTV